MFIFMSFIAVIFYLNSFDLSQHQYYLINCSLYYFFSSEKCAPYIYFPFDNTVKDVNGKTASGGSNAWIRKTDPAAIGGGAVYFNGRRQVIAWALNNMEFRSNFTLHFRFKLDVLKTSASQRIALIDNSDCDKEATFGVALLTSSDRTGTVHGGFRLKNGEAVTINSPELVSILPFNRRKLGEPLPSGTKHSYDVWPF